MRIIVAATALALAAATPAAVGAQTPAAPAAATAGHYSVETTDIGTLLDDPAAKAVVEKNLPGFTTNPQIDMARSMTLKGIQQYSSDTMTDAKLAAIQADLAKLPPKK